VGNRRSFPQSRHLADRRVPGLRPPPAGNLNTHNPNNVFDHRLQGMMGIFVMVISSLLQAYYKPFIDPQLNSLELLSLAGSAATFFFGIFTMDGGTSGAVMPHASLLAFIFNIFVLLVILRAGRNYVFVKEPQPRDSLQSHSVAGSNLVTLGFAETFDNTHAAVELAILASIPELPRESTTAEETNASSPPHAKHAEHSRVKFAEPGPQFSISSEVVGVDAVNNATAVQLAPTNCDNHTGSEVPQSLADSDVKPLSLVVALFAYEAKKSNQLTLAKGDVIQVLDSSKAWHVGRVFNPATNKVISKQGFFPPSCVQAHTHILQTSSTEGLESTLALPSAAAAQPAALRSPPPLAHKNSDNRVPRSLVRRPNNVMNKKQVAVVSRAFTGTRPNQLSVERGDFVRVSN
jgi:hypothetical protein